MTDSADHPRILIEEERPDNGDPLADLIGQGLLTEHSDGRKTLRLTRPLSLRFRKPGGEEREETLEELTFRRATGADLREVGKHTRDNAVAAALTLTSRLTGQPERVIDQLDGEDASNAAVVANGFFGTPRRNGKN